MLTRRAFFSPFSLPRPRPVRHHSSPAGTRLHPRFRQVATLVARVLDPTSASRVTDILDELDANRAGGDADDDASRAREAETLYKTLARWQDAPGRLHERVQAGNCIYRHAAQVSFF